jgi:transcriptional regulator with XRE-family HTH domain
VALFFDQVWFRARLEALNLSKADLALCLGLTRDELDEIWKDQREVSRQEVSTLSAILGVDAREIANRCGISTPIPDALDGDVHRVSDLERRVKALEHTVELLLAARKKPS